MSCNFPLISIHNLERFFSCAVNQVIFEKLKKKNLMAFIHSPTSKIGSPFLTLVNPIAKYAGDFRKKSLKHKDSFAKSENLSKIFFTEIVVFHPDYECKSSSSNDLL